MKLFSQMKLASLEGATSKFNQAKFFDFQSGLKKLSELTLVLVEFSLLQKNVILQLKTVK